MNLKKQNGVMSFAGFLYVGLLIGLFAGEAEAIPPPELIRLGPVLAQVLALILVFFSTMFFVVRNRLYSLFSAIRGRWLKLVLISIPVLIVVLAVIVSSAYVSRKNKDILALAPPAADSTTVSDGIVMVAGMQFDITDPLLAISPTETAKLLGNGKYLFIDIREPVEFATRHIPGFINIRVGDLVAGAEYKKIDKNRNIILVCEAGERGSAIAAFLKVRGYQALFVEKGIRGWREQKQKFIGNEKMMLPDFRNKYKAVKTDEAKTLVAKGKALLVDVRSSAEYGRGHVAGALNIPLVNMPSGELEKALNDLPKDKVLIGVSYDRFGSYYCMILGYLVDQKKMEYGGTLRFQPKNQTL